MKLIKYLCIFILITSCNKTETYLNLMKEDVAILSHDSLSGRETGTKGEKIASEYIKKRFKTLNLKPILEEGYIQKFNFKTTSNPHQAPSFTSFRSHNVST